MGYILGLDIGTNSIGWAILRDRSIVDLGIRIFPVGVKEDLYNKSGTEESKSSARRTARGIRRLYDRYKLRRRQLKKLLLSLDMMPPEILSLSSRELYALRAQSLDERITLQELGRIILLLNQRRGFKSNKKEKGSSDQKKELEGIKLQMEELEMKIASSGCRTVGEYFYSLFTDQSSQQNWHNTDEPVERIRKRFVFRKTYEKEFDLIWSKQKEYYPDVLTEGNYKKLKENCLYYQRPLKSQKHLVGKCRFEPQKRVAPKSSFDFQEFRIWQFINNLRITGGNRFRESLTLEEKLRAAGVLQDQQEMSVAKLKTELNLPKSYSFQKDLPQKIKGNTTNAKLQNALGKENFDSLSGDVKYKLWHTLYFANDEEWLEKYSQKDLKLTPEQTKEYMKINLEEEYGNLSVKAIRKILPFMKAGFDYAQACEEAGYHHSFDEVEDGKERELKDKIERNKEDDLRNPLVQQAVAETIRLVNEIIKEYGKPEAVRVEFARQLKWTRERREKYKSQNDEKERTRDTYREFLKHKLQMENVSKSDLLKFELWLEMEFSETELEKITRSIDMTEFRKFAKHVKPGDKQKYELWLECGRISPYSGKVINLHALFSPAIEVEHILPFSRSLDDSFGNKTLCEREINAAKGNRTPFEYLGENPYEWQKFLDRVKSFSEGKQAKFSAKDLPADFISQQLNNTAYIAKQARKKLKTVCPDVTVTNGQATSFLRRLWGLNTILNPKGENVKSRHDHRHHAVDALVIASTTPADIKMLSDYAKFDASGKLTLRDAPTPFLEFREQAKELLSTVFISYKNKKRLITTKKNKYIHSRKDCSTANISIRGPLHEETFFGKISNPHTGKEEFVIRKPLVSIETEKHIAKIIDPAIKALVIKHVQEHGGNIKSAMAIDLFMTSKSGKKIPVKKVRMQESSEDLIQLRPNENNKLFVSSGSNYLMAIYEKEGKRTFENVSFYEAVQRRLKGLPIFPIEKDGKAFLLSLTQKDLVVVYENDPDEIDWENKAQLFESLYLVRKFDRNGNICFAKHNLSNVNPDHPKDYPSGWVLKKSSNRLRAIKVRISITGKLIRI